MELSLFAFSSINALAAFGAMSGFGAVAQPRLAVDARQKFNDHIDLLDGLASGRMYYEEFAGRLGRRFRGEAEDFDEDTHPPFPEKYRSAQRLTAPHPS